LEYFAKLSLRMTFSKIQPLNLSCSFMWVRLWRFLISASQYLIQTVNRSSQVWNGYRATNNERHIERSSQFQGDGMVQTSQNNSRAKRGFAYKT